MKRILELISPQGKQEITVGNKESLQIILQDEKPGSREFELHITMKGKKSLCHIVGRAESQKNDSKKWSITSDLTNEYQELSVDLKGIGKNSGKLNLQASGTMHQSAPESSIDIKGHILLFDEAKGYALPSLTIKTNKVIQASHASSVTYIDYEKVLFLASRGIPNNTAEKMLQKGFLQY